MDLYRTSKVVGADTVCGHPSSYHALRDAWKFQVTPTLQSASEQMVFDRPAVSNHARRQIAVEVSDVL